MKLVALISILVASSVSADLIASYSFSGNAMDQSGNGQHGIVHGATLTADRFGNSNAAYSFDGINDYIDLPNMGLSGEVSVSAWVSFTGNIWPHHITVLGQATHYFERWTFGVSNQEIFWYDRRGSDNQPYNIIRETEEAVWHHIVAVVDPSLPLKVGLYVDGDFLGRVSTRGFQDIGTAYQVGSFFTEWGWEFSRGRIDDLNIYDHGLSEREIAKLYGDHAVPEPATAIMFLAGVAILVQLLRRKPSHKGWSGEG